MWEDDDDGKPKSYLMSLLIIKAYHNVGEVMQKTKKFKNLAVE